MHYLSVSSLAEYFSELFHGLPSGIIFDCDGVVIDSKAANIAYYNYLRKYIGLPELTREQEDFVQAATVQQAMDAIFPKPLQPLLRDAARAISYVRDIMPRIESYPGLHSVLDFCKSSGIFLAMDTNRTDGMDMLLDNCRLHGYFDPIVLASHVSAPKPSPEGALLILKKWKVDAGRVLFIGDSSSDKGAAEGASIPFLCFQTEGLSEKTISDFGTLLEALKSAKR
ncbi:MAG: HAD family hydrolase [Mailhella sp.]